MRIVRFDDSLPILADSIAAMLGEDALASGTVLRDAVGCLAFFAADALAPQDFAKVSSALHVALGPYARPDRVLACPDDYGAAAVRDDGHRWAGRNRSGEAGHMCAHAGHAS